MKYTDLASQADKALEGVTADAASELLEEARKGAKDLSYHPTVRKLFGCLADIVAALIGMSAKYEAAEAKVAELTRERDEAVIGMLAWVKHAEKDTVRAMSAEAKVARLEGQIKDWEARIDDCEWSANSSLTEGIRAEMLAAIRKGATP